MMEYFLMWVGYYTIQFMLCFAGSVIGMKIAEKEPWKLVTFNKKYFAKKKSVKTHSKYCI